MQVAVFEAEAALHVKLILAIWLDKVDMDTLALFTTLSTVEIPAEVAILEVPHPITVPELPSVRTIK